jgi:hypothetical protein
MATVYVNQKWDPSGGTYRTWTSEDSPDTTGANYVGPPAYGTLTGENLVAMTYEVSGSAIDEAWQRSRLDAADSLPGSITDIDDTWTIS